MSTKDLELAVDALTDAVRESNVLLAELLDEIRAAPGPRPRLPIKNVVWACDCEVGGGDRGAPVHHEGCAASRQQSREAAGVVHGHGCPSGGGPDCWACSGEACWKCGLDPDPPCDHDVLERHDGPSPRGEAVGVVHAPGCDADPCTCGKVGSA